MPSLAELETAADALPAQEKRESVRFLLSRLGEQQSNAASAQPASHSVLDIEPLSIGEILRPLGPDDDLLGEMLEGRP